MNLWEVTLLFISRFGDPAGVYSPFFSFGQVADEVAQMTQTRLDTSSRDLHEGLCHVAAGMYISMEDPKMRPKPSSHP